MSVVTGPVAGLEESDPFSSDKIKNFVITWGPRAIFAVIAGYYSLGVAYDIGLMAAIDRVAIDVLKHYIGYAGLGAAMPTFQWYSAWAVRISAAAAGGLLYDVLERISLYVFHNCFPQELQGIER
ncbi:MAG: hypothetical protein Tsb0015_11020 [Simkaniaceae bacterium]